MSRQGPIVLLASVLAPACLAGETVRLPQPEPAAGAYLSELEGEVLDEVNLARSDPAAYARHVEALLPRFRGKLLLRPGTASLQTEEGAPAAEEAAAALRRAPPAPALEPSRGLWRAAADHAGDLGRTGEVGHVGSDGSRPVDRIERYGKWTGTAGEVIAFFGSGDPREIVVQLLVDDGVPGRGHRRALLNPDFRVAGVACGPHRVFRQVCVIDLAASFR